MCSVPVACALCFCLSYLPLWTILASIIDTASSRMSSWRAIISRLPHFGFECFAGTTRSRSQCPQHYPSSFKNLPLLRRYSNQFLSFSLQKGFPHKTIRHYRNPRTLAGLAVGENGSVEGCSTHSPQLASIVQILIRSP